MRPFYNLLLPAALFCTTALHSTAALPLAAAVPPGAETVTPAQIAAADRPATSREEAQEPRAGEQAIAEAIAAKTAAPQTAPPASTVSSTRVTFAPTDGARFERLLTSQSSSAANGDATGIRAVRTQVEERWEKSGEQWLLHCTPIDVSVQDSTASPVSQIKQAELRQPYTIVFDAEGKLLEVRGFDDIAEQTNDLFGDTLNPPAQYSEALRRAVAASFNYQLNWLFGKRWRVGEEHKSDLYALAMPQWAAEQSEQTATVAAIDSHVLILNFESTGAFTNADANARVTASEKGTATLDPVSGQLRQLQKTRLIEMQAPGPDGNTVSSKNTEVLTIVWQRVED